MPGNHSRLEVLVIDSNDAISVRKLASTTRSEYGLLASGLCKWFLQGWQSGEQVGLLGAAGRVHRL